MDRADIHDYEVLEMQDNSPFDGILDSALALDRCLDFWVKHFDELTGNNTAWVVETQRTFSGSDGKTKHIYELYGPKGYLESDCFETINVLKALNIELRRGIVVIQIPKVDGIPFAEYGEISASVSVESYKSKNFVGEVEVLSINTCLTREVLKNIGSLIECWGDRRNGRNDLIELGKKLNIDALSGHKDYIGLFGGQLE